MGACVAAFEAITKVKLTVEQGGCLCLLKAVRSQQETTAQTITSTLPPIPLMEAASDPDYGSAFEQRQWHEGTGKDLLKHGLPVSPLSVGRQK